MAKQETKENYRHTYAMIAAFTAVGGFIAILCGADMPTITLVWVIVCSVQLSAVLAHLNKIEDDTND